MKRVTLILSIAVLIIGCIHAQENLKKHPGYIDLSSIEIPAGAGEVTEVNIGPELFSMFRNFANDDQSQAPFNGDTFSINIKSFNIDSLHSEAVRKEMEKIEKKLQKENWTSIVRVKSGEEMTNISVKFDKGTQKSMGMLIMSLEPGNEASFVNIVGSVPLDALENLDVDMDVSALDSLKHVLKEDASDE